MNVHRKMTGTPSTKVLRVLFSAPKQAPVSGESSWSPERDAAVLSTKGQYAQIRKLADCWCVADRVVLARWHKLRVRANG